MTRRGVEPPVDVVELWVDGSPIGVSRGSTVLEACDLAGVYVPRLCTYPGLRCCASADAGDTECGLCIVRLGDGATVLACATAAEVGMQVVTSDEELRRTRRERLAETLEGHPFICLLCPDRDGCSRDECSYGNPPESRCCERYGRCELASLLAFLDPEGSLRPAGGPFAREAVIEGPIRREPGLCVGCGRCIVVCHDEEGKSGRSLQMVAGAPAGGRRPRAVPRGPSLRAAGCTFCGRCVLVCPTGSLTTAGETGERWLERHRGTSGLAEPVLPPERRLTVGEARDGLGAGPGVLQLLDGQGEVLFITGVPDMARGLEQALRDLGPGVAAYVRAEPEPLYTQRESELLTRYTRRYGHLPQGNDLGGDLYDDEEDD